MSKELILVCDGCGTEIVSGSAHFSAQTVTAPDNRVYDHIDLHPMPSCWQDWGNKVYPLIPPGPPPPPAPQVTATIPASGTQVADPSIVKISFNHVLDTDKLTPALSAYNNTQSSSISIGAISYSPATETATITLVGTWTSGDEIQVTVAGTIQNLVGISMGSDYQWAFIVAS